MTDDTQSGTASSFPQTESSTVDRPPFPSGPDRTRSDPDGLSASHPGKPEPLSDNERAKAGTPPAAEGTGGQRPPVNDDTGSLSSKPATFAHAQDKAAKPGNPPGDDEKESANPAEEQQKGPAMGLWLCAGLALGFVAGLALLQPSSRSGRHPG